MSPGPDVFFVLSASSKSKKNGIFAALGIFFGNLLLTILIILTGSQLASGFPIIFSWIKFIGAAYLLFLGSKIIFLFFNARAEKSEIGKADQFTPEEPKIIFSKGILMCITNPKAVLYFISFLPQYIFIEKAISWISVIVVLSLSLCWFLTVATIGNRIFNRIAHKSRAWIDFSFGIVLILFGVFLITETGV